MKIREELKAGLIRKISLAYHKVCRWIPDGINNRRLMRILDMLRFMQRPLGRRFNRHESENAAAFVNHEKAIRKNNGYIEDQNRYTDLAFGKKTMQFSGCEIFAVYNALTSLADGHGTSLARLISTFERDGMILSGLLGTAPSALRDYFKKRGYRTEFVTDEEDFDRVAGAHDTLILVIYNDAGDAAQAVHTVNVSKNRGLYSAHNVYCNGLRIGPFPTVKELISNINRGRARGIAALGISRPLKDHKSQDSNV
ncbi:MAG: hypothetical protein IJH71_01860 [Eubacterium sp.]|nr:hypothetical protein [Eubacterium sp.]